MSRLPRGQRFANSTCPVRAHRCSRTLFDPASPELYSGLADAYAILSTYGGNPKETYAKANAAAFRALELDSSLAHPHAVLGSVEMEYGWDFAAGEAEYKKTFELDPDDATAHHWYAQDIGWLGRG